MTQLRISRGRTLQCAGRDCIVLVLVVLCAAPALAQLQADITPLGEIDRLTVGEQIVARGIHVTIIKPEWKGSWGSQKDAASLSMERTEADGAVRFSGQFACEGKPCALEQTLTTRPDGVSLSYKLTPSADMDTQQIAVMVDLPTEGNAGAGAFYIHDGDIALKTPPPAELPDPYHLAGSGEIAWCGWTLPGDVGLRITPDGKGIRGVSFQDNRQFNYGTFEAQFAVHDSQGLRAGRTYEFGLDLALMTQADKEALKTTVSDRYEGARVQMASQEPLSLGGVSVSSGEVARYEKLELDLDLHATFDNPFNPDEIDVTARFSGPDGRVMVVPAFYWSDFDWAGKREERWLITTGTPRWKVRFAPPSARTLPPRRAKSPCG